MVKRLIFYSIEVLYCNVTLYLNLYHCLYCVTFPFSGRQVQYSPKPLDSTTSDIVEPFPYSLFLSVESKLKAVILSINYYERMHRDDYILGLS